jgi:hypothetical protein
LKEKVDKINLAQFITGLKDSGNTEPEEVLRAVL